MCISVDRAALCEKVPQLRLNPAELEQIVVENGAAGRDDQVRADQRGEGAAGSSCGDLRAPSGGGKMFTTAAKIVPIHALYLGPLASTKRRPTGRDRTLLLSLAMPMA